MKQLVKILKFAGNLWPYYLAVMVFSVLLALSTMVIPFAIKGVTDMVVGIIQGQQPDYWLGFLYAVALFGSDVAQTIFSNIGGYYGDMMAAKLKKQLSERYYQHLMTLPQSYYDSELTGTIINRLNRTISEVSNFMNFFANNFLQMILSLVITLVVVAYFSWEVALMLFVIYPIFLWLTTITSKKWQQYQEKKNKHTDIASGRFAESVGQIRVVKSYGQEQRELKLFDKHYSKTIDLTREQSKLWHNMDIARRLVLNILFFAIFGFIFWQTIAGRFSIGEMFLLITLSQYMRFPIFSMSFIVDNTQHAITGSRDYFKVMELEPAIADKPGAEELKVKEGTIEYNNVVFDYNDKERVLKGISFKVEAGKKAALVGESGEGKTTITSLLMRLYEPRSGSITIDGTNVADVTQESLRSQIAVVFQDPSLFSGTIIENITYSRPGASKKQVIAAAKAANAHEFISKLPKGYDTEIGERGLKLSGGQKQRIAIARAILKDAPILILDEATSSLDSKAESLVQEALERLMRGRTTLIIAHRLSTIAHVDQIITLRGGKVDEVGSPAKLARTNGIYAQLLKLQTGATETAKKKLKEFDIAAS